MRPAQATRRIERIFALAVAAAVAIAGQTFGTASQAAATENPFGPRPTMTCPAGAVEIPPGLDIQTAVNANPEGTAFCMKAGVHSRTSAIVPKTGNSFTGEYGAIIDGSGWRTDDPHEGLFRAHNQDIDHVIIRNLVIRNSPQSGIHAFTDHSDRWIIAHNDIHGNRVGISHGDFFQIRGNLVRRNWQYGIVGFRSTGSVIAGNRFAFNAERYRSFPMDSASSKWARATNTMVRRNVFVDNFNNGIWFDGGHRGVRIERNIVRRNGNNGIFTEVGGSTIIRRNVVRGHHRGIYISESRGTRVRRNRLANNDRAIWLYQDGNRRAESQLGNNRIVRNVIRVPRRPVIAGITPMATGLTCANMTAGGCAAYSNRRGNAFHRNVYRVGNGNIRYWYWPNSLKTWGTWRAAGQDSRGRLRAG